MFCRLVKVKTERCVLIYILTLSPNLKNRNQLEKDSIKQATGRAPALVGNLQNVTEGI